MIFFHDKSCVSNDNLRSTDRLCIVKIYLLECFNYFCLLLLIFFSGVSATLAALTPRLKDFHQLLEDPPPVSCILFLLFDLLYMPFLVQLLQHKCDDYHCWLFLLSDETNAYHCWNIRSSTWKCSTSDLQADRCYLSH